MKIAIVGSRETEVANFEQYVSDGDEIVTGGAAGIDRCAEKYANEKGLKLTVFLPRYDLYGRAAPIVRNKRIVDYADRVVAFWDGTSKGTLSVIRYAEKTGKPCETVWIAAKLP